MSVQKCEYYRGLQTATSTIVNPQYCGDNIVADSGRAKSFLRFNKGVREVFYPGLSTSILDQIQYQAAPRTDGPKVKLFTNANLIGSEELPCTMHITLIPDGTPGGLKCIGKIWQIDDNQDGTVKVHIDLENHTFSYVSAPPDPEDLTVQQLVSGHHFVALPQPKRIVDAYAEPKFLVPYDLTMPGDTATILHEDLTNRLFYAKSVAPCSGYDRTAELGPLTVYPALPANASDLRHCDTVDLIDPFGELAAVEGTTLQGVTIQTTSQGVIHPAAAITLQYLERGTNNWSTIDPQYYVIYRAEGWIWVAKTIVDALPTNFCLRVLIGAPGLANYVPEVSGELIRSAASIAAALDTLPLSSPVASSVAIAKTAYCVCGARGPYQVWLNAGVHAPEQPSWWLPTGSGAAHGLFAGNIETPSGSIPPARLIKGTTTPTGRYGYDIVEEEGEILEVMAANGQQSIGCRSDAYQYDNDLDVTKKFSGAWVNGHFHPVSMIGLLAQIPSGSIITEAKLRIRLSGPGTYYRSLGDRYFWALTGQVGTLWEGAYWGNYVCHWNPETNGRYLNNQYEEITDAIPSVNLLLYVQSLDGLSWSFVASFGVGQLTTHWKYFDATELIQTLINIRDKYRSFAIVMGAGGPVPQDPNFYAAGPGNKAFLASIMSAWETIENISDTLDASLIGDPNNPNYIAVGNPSNDYSTCFAIPENPDYQGSYDLFMSDPGYQHVLYERKWSAWVGPTIDLGSGSIRYRLPSAAIKQWLVQGIYPVWI